MQNCETPKILAYFMAAYMMSSIIYLIVTSTMGTPFKDSLTTAQRRVQRESSRKRSRVFLLGMLISGIILYLTEPFKSCGE